MTELIEQLQQWLTGDRMWAIGRAALLLFVGFLLAKLLSGAVNRLVRKRTDAQQQLLLRRVIFYPILLLFLAAALHEAGFKLGVLLGAAGVLTVAVGFASQTSASNIISGLFLMAEQPFKVGDLIQVGDTTGEVLSIDLLSVKLRTFNNIFVRVPNETVIKSEVRTLTRFPIRRYDLKLGVAYREDLERVRETLLEVAKRNPLCLEQPAPVVFLDGFGESSIDLQFSVWAERDSYLELKNSILPEIKHAFDQRNIEIPFPQRTIAQGPDERPLQVELVPGQDR